MTPAVETALIQLGIRLADRLILDVIVPWIESLLAAQANPVDSLSAAREIVLGISEAHPDWPSSQKAEYARDALRLYLKGQGAVDVADRDLNWMVESAVQAISGGRHAGTPPPAADRSA